MKKNIILILIGFMMSILFVPFFYTKEAMSATSQSTGDNWWNKFGKPRYGGTLTIRASQLNTVSLDPMNPMGGQFAICYESLFAMETWTTDRKIFSFQTMFIPLEYRQPLLAESWEQKDSLTYIIHLRKEIKWQKNGPVNGRELTAYDIAFNYNRLLGNGDLI